MANQLSQLEVFFKWAFGKGSVRGSCAYSIGYNAGLMHDPKLMDASETNPYRPHSDDWSDWRAGYEDGCDAIYNSEASRLL
ncbi:hypothetical protein [Phyllobacterium sp. 628]|uniref:hypothetical protein n=1 Tax=Phyllobacterium sp. 628 TaxID=2718938 RepID=UPI001AEE4816|nr:hypothetical protein [Phyllobacterium sp. 628]